RLRRGPFLLWLEFLRSAYNPRPEGRRPLNGEHDVANMIEKIWTVLESGLLLHLDRQEFGRLEAQTQARPLPENCQLLFPEAARARVFVVVSGRLGAHFHSENRLRRISVELTPGDFFGVHHGQDPAAIGDDLELLERSTIVAIPRDAFQILLNGRSRLRNSAR